MKVHIKYELLLILNATLLVEKAKKSGSYIKSDRDEQAEINPIGPLSYPAIIWIKSPPYLFPSISR